MFLRVYRFEQQSRQCSSFHLRVRSRHCRKSICALLTADSNVRELVEHSNPPICTAINAFRAIVLPPTACLLDHHESWTTRLRFFHTDDLMRFANASLSFSSFSQALAIPPLGTDLMIHEKQRVHFSLHPLLGLGVQSTWSRRREQRPRCTMRIGTEVPFFLSCLHFFSLYFGLAMYLYLMDAATSLFVLKIAIPASAYTRLLFF